MSATKPTTRSDERVLQSAGAPLWGYLPPQYAALARGALIAAIIAAISFVVQSIQSGAIVAPPEWAWILSVVVVALRGIEGAIDSRSAGKVPAP